MEEVTSTDILKPTSKLTNLGNKRHYLTREDASRAGKTMTPFRLKSLQLRGIEYCGSKCPIYPCRYQPLSGTKYDNRCALKHLEPSVRRKYINLLCGGEDELFTEATNALMSIDDGFKTVSAVEKIHKMRFGDKVHTESTVRTVHDINVSIKLKRLIDEGRNSITLDDIEE